MIYEGKEYKEVTDGSTEIGDLLSATKAIHKDGQFSHLDKMYYFALDNEKYPLTERTTQNGYRIKAYPPKPFKRYRHVEDVEEITTNVFKSGDRVRLTEFELNGQINFGSFNGYVDGEKFDGDYKVKFDDGTFGFFPSSSLELINQTSKNIKQTDKVNSPSLSENINDLFTEIKDIIVAKNENYGDSFSKQYQKYGMVSVEMRLNDKMMRLEQLVKGEKDKVGESVEDTLKDIIGYATLALIELECEQNGK